PCARSSSASEGPPRAPPLPCQPSPRPRIRSPRVPLAHRAAVAGILAHPGASRKGARGLTLGPEDAQNPRDAPHGNRVVAPALLPGRLLLRPLSRLSLLFGFTPLFMIILAALFPRASTILIVQFY